MRPTIQVCLPTRGYIHVKTMKFLMDCMKCDYDIDISTCISRTSANPAQNRLFTNAFYEGVDYLFAVDCDVIPPSDTLSMLVNADKDIVVAPVWHPSDGHMVHINIHRESVKIQETVVGESGLERIVSSSFGCILIKKKVLKTFVSAGESFFEWSPLIDDYFIDKFSDMIFFAKCAKLGIETWVNWDIKNAIHFREFSMCTELVENISKYYKLPLDKSKKE